MKITILRGRPEDRFRFAIGLLVGAVVALPINVLTLATQGTLPELGYVFIACVLAGGVFHKRPFVVGATSSIFAVSLPQAVAAILPTPLTNWHVSAGVLWLIAFGTLGCLYLMREAQTRTNADIDAWWLFQTEDQR